MKNILLTSAFLLSSFWMLACDYTLELIDNWGDGWDGGAEIEVWINGSYQNVYAPTGSSLSVTITANQGDNIELYYKAGTYESENEWNLYNPDGILVASDGPTPSTGWVLDISSDCGLQNDTITAGDCSSAINICNNTELQIDANGFGAVNEIPALGSLGNPNNNNPGGSGNDGCLRVGESNSTWMIINVSGDGDLEFNFGGDSQAGYFDWIMYPYNSNSCNDIANNLVAPIRCNWNSSDAGGTGLDNTITGMQVAGNFEPALPVQCGEQYIICFSNYSSAVTTVPLVFGGTATVACMALTCEQTSLCNVAPGNTEYQDCINAIPVNQNEFCQANSFSGVGAITGEISSVISCLGVGEKNDVWYVFTAQDTGSLSFLITPNDITDDYDFAVFNLTDKNCSEIKTDASLQVSCNFSGTAGNTGANGSSAYTSQGSGGTPYNAVIPVQNGEVYVLNVSNFTSSQSGYYLSFAGSSNIVDTFPPTLQLEFEYANLGTTYIPIVFNEDIQALVINSADFTLTGLGGPYNISIGSTGSKSLGVKYSKSINLNISPAINDTGLYVLDFTNVNASLKDIYGNLALPQSFQFRTYDLSNTVNTTNATCLGIEDGSASVTPIAGVSPYTYLWSNGVTDSVIFNVTAGTYYVTTTDSNFVFKVDTVIISGTTVISTTVNSTVPWCFGMTNGTAEIFASSGTTPYNYNWSTTQNSAYIENLAGGTYYITVSDAIGCYAVDSAVIVTPDKLTVSAIITNPTTIGGSDGTIDITISGGTLPMNTIDWFSYGTNEDISNLSAGLYQLSLRDANSCGVDTIFTLTDPPCNLQVNFDITDVSCYGLSDGSAIMHISNGFEPYSFGWAGAYPDTIVTNLSANAYNVTVIDAVGCEVQTMAWIQEPDTISVSAWGSDLLCFGDSNGTASVTAYGGTTPYNYLWSTGETTSNIELQTSNTYVFTITDINGCQFVDSVYVTQPSAITLSAIITNVTTVGGSDGAIDITAVGGTPSYTHDWSNYLFMEDIAALSAGTYYVTTYDANNCQVVDSFVVADPVCNIVTSISQLSNVSCKFWNDASAIVVASSGTSPDSYNWSTGESDATAYYLSAGMQYVSVIDVIGCSAIDSILITEPDELMSDIIVTNVICYRTSTGSASLIPYGGTPPYSYNWYFGSTDSLITGLPVGNYEVEIFDSNGCITFNNATIIQPDSIIISGSTISSSGNNGSIDITVTNGIAPFAYLWSNSETTEDVSGLIAGTFYVTVTDNNGCSNTATFIVNDSIICNGFDVSLSSTNISCNGSADGEIIATVSGGTQPYNYSWSTGGTSAIITNLNEGVYFITVIDSNNCTFNSFVSIIEPEELTTSITTTNPTCFESNDGTANLTITGGTTPYDIVWYKDLFGPSYIYANTEDLTGMIPALYGVIVTDANGCSTPMSLILGVTYIQIEEAQQIFVSGNVSPENLGNDGAIDITVINGTSPFTYVWSNGATTEDITGLTNGFYSVSVTDNNGCTAQNSFLLNDPTCVMYSDISSISDVSCYSGNNGEVTMQSYDGVSPYTYNWSNGQTTETITGLQEGSYDLTVTDANSCVFVTNVYIQQPDSMVIQFDVSNVTCNSGNDGSIITNFYGGTSPYNYLWSNSEISIDINGLSAGLYTLSVTDNFGCTQSESVEITEPSQIVNNLAETICNGDSIFVGGAWQFSDGIFHDTITSIAGCDSVIVTTLSILQTPVVDLGPLDTLCTPETSWDINLDAGNAGATYLWSTGETIQQIHLLGEQLHFPGLDSVWVTVSYGNCSVTDTKYIWLDVCEGIALVDNKIEVNIYPNPAANEVFIEISNNEQRISNDEVFRIYGLEGKLVKQGNLESSKTRISTKDLESGVYFIEVNVGAGKMTNKLVITK